MMEVRPTLMTENYGEKLRRLMEARKLSQGEVSRRTYDPNKDPKQIHKGYIGRIINGVTKPGEEIMLRVAQAMGYNNLGDFMSEEKSKTPTKQETKNTVLTEVRKLLEKLDKEEPEYTLEEIPTGSLPVLDEVSAGSGIEPVDITAMPGIGIAPENTMSFRVRGLCLEPKIPNGTTLVIHKTRQPVNDNLVVVILNGKSSVKRYKDDGAGNIHFENNYGNYLPKQVQMIGVVIGIFPPGGVK